MRLILAFIMALMFFTGPPVEASALQPYSFEPLSVQHDDQASPVDLHEVDVPDAAQRARLSRRLPSAVDVDCTADTTTFETRHVDHVKEGAVRRSTRSVLARRGTLDRGTVVADYADNLKSTKDGRRLWRIVKGGPGHDRGANPLAG